MKASRLLAGLLIVLLGVALFLSNFDVINVNWDLVFKLWPVLLIFAGISVLVHNEKWKAALYVLTTILVVIWILSAISEGSRSFHDVFDGDGSVRVQEFSTEMSKDISHAEFTLNAGAGKFSIADTTGSVLAAKAETNLGDYTFNSDKNGTTENLSLSMENHSHAWWFGGSRNDVKVRLNSGPDWRLNLNVGACKGDFDLAPYKVRSANIDAGASKITVRLGDKSDTTDLSFDTGVSKLTVYVPSSSGCRIDDKAQLSSKSFRHFTKTDDGRYVTPNFQNTSKKVFISIDAGVSSIKVVRY